MSEQNESKKLSRSLYSEKLIDELKNVATNTPLRKLIEPSADKSSVFSKEGGVSSASLKSILEILVSLTFPELSPCSDIKSEKADLPVEERLLKGEELFSSFFKSSHRRDGVFQHISNTLDEGLLSDSTETAYFFREAIKELPNVREKLVADATFILVKDPAASCVEEIVLCYPGFYAILLYRIANLFFQMKLPVLPRFITEFAHRETGIDIHPGARIDTPFAIDHGTGIVIGETSIIGKEVIIYQGVTLGALSVKKENTQKRHPTVMNNVTIYANATILGGETVIGENSIIGGNVFLTKSVPSGSKVYYSN